MPAFGADEDGRLEALRAYALLDTPAEPAFDDLTALAAHACAAPIALVSFIDDRRQWIKSKVGVSVSELPREHAFCTHTIRQRDVFVVADAAADPRFSTNPLVTGELRIRAYAGAPLVTDETRALGTLSVMDRAPRGWTPPELQALGVIGAQVMAQLELRRLRQGLDRDRRPATADDARAVDANRLAAIVESSNDAIIGKDLSGIITSWNHGAEAIFGYAAEEIIGSSIMRLVPADLTDQENEILRRIRGGQPVTHLETRRLTKDGRLIDVSITSSPIRDGFGRVVGASKVARDITVAKRADDQLREREEQLRLYAEHSPVAVAMFDRDMKYLVASRRWMDDFRLGDESIVGRSHYEVLPEIPERWKDVHQRCLAGAVEACEEDPFRRADGTIDWIRWEIRPWHRADGTIGGIIIFSENVTERNRAIEALRTAEERMRFALENAEVGIWDADYRTGVVRWSEILEAQHGLKPGTFGGTIEAFLACVHPEDRASVRGRVEKAAKSGADFVLEHRIVRPDGVVRWHEGVGRIHLGPDGTPVRGVGISLDVTERHMLEGQYQQAQKMEAVGRLAGGVAHDFNNLLSAILGYCGLLLEDVKPEDPIRADLLEIQKAGTSAAALTRQLLAFSRKQIIEPVLLDFNAVVRDVQGMLGRLIGEDVRVVLGLSPEPMLANADRGQIEQILLNLAVNARDAMPTGGTMTIETAGVELDETYTAAHFDVTPGSYVALTVTDTGTGMTPEVKAHLFEPFFTTKEVGKGTGLGLATVHGIVMRAGGNVGVYSELGQGTSFKVYFPRADAAELPVEAPRTGARLRAGTQTVLVVEDADVLRELVRRVLQRQGYSVLVAANADEARTLFERHASIDLLLTDVVMPGASGPELTEELVARRPGLKVVYMSGYTQDAIVQRGVLKPGIAFLHKPFTAETLGRKLREVLDR